MPCYYRNRLKQNLLAAGLLIFAVASSCAYSVMNVRMHTDFGGIDIVLRDDLAPKTVTNFLNYMTVGAYDDTFIHRNITGFTIQGGGYKFDPADGSFFSGGASRITENSPVVNESDLPGHLLNEYGTLAMARMSDPDSATSQWFFNPVDNPGLDDDPGTPLVVEGFTVFGEVQPYDLGVIDRIGIQDVCSEILVNGFICSFTQFTDTIIVGATTITAFDPDRLLLVNNIGFDNDVDGVIDRVEDAAPNAGNANFDASPDSTQNNVASFSASNGDYIVIETPMSISLSVDVLGAVFELAHPPTSFCELNGLDFRHNFFGFDLEGVTAGGGTTVTVTLPAGESPDTYYNFGPTPGNPSPHWYEFLYDSETGAEFSGNVITLHFMDGMRGDADLDDNNGVIVTTGGSALKLAAAVVVDDDGIFDSVEDGAPNSGDGNNDGILDSLQGNVASFADLNGDYLTIETETTVPVKILSADVRTLPSPASGILDGRNFSHGFISFEMCSGSATTVKMILPEGEAPDSYFMFGPTPGNTNPHYYNFSFDGETGAEFDGNVITLHFVDGKRGDSDLDGSNGAISDPGAPAFLAINTLAGGGGGGGGCSLGGTDRNPATAGTWWLLMTLILMLWTRKVRKHRVQ